MHDSALLLRFDCPTRATIHLAYLLPSPVPAKVCKKKEAARVYSVLSTSSTSFLELGDGLLLLQGTRAVWGLQVVVIVRVRRASDM